MSNHKEKIDSFIQNTLLNIRKLIEANVIVGNPIQAGKSTIIPINKATVGYITGGGEITNKKTPQFTIGSTSGFNITPIGFIYVDNGNATFISTQPCTPNDKLLDAIYKIICKKFNETNEDADECKKQTKKETKADKSKTKIKEKKNETQ